MGVGKIMLCNPHANARMHIHSSNPFNGRSFCDQFLPAFSSRRGTLNSVRSQIKQLFAELVRTSCRQSRSRKDRLLIREVFVAARDCNKIQSILDGVGSRKITPRRSK